MSSQRERKSFLPHEETLNEGIIKMIQRQKVYVITKKKKKYVYLNHGAEKKLFQKWI